MYDMVTWLTADTISWRWNPRSIVDNMMDCDEVFSVFEHHLHFLTKNLGKFNGSIYLFSIGLNRYYSSIRVDFALNNPWIGIFHWTKDTKSGYRDIYEVPSISFQTFFVWALLLIVHTWNSSALRSNLPWLRCTCTVPTNSGRPHGSPFVWGCQWSSSRPLSSPQLSHNDNLLVFPWDYWITKSHWTKGRATNCLDTHLGQIVCEKDGVVDWCIILMEMPLTRFEECWRLPTEYLPELP